MTPAQPVPGAPYGARFELDVLGRNVVHPMDKPFAEDPANFLRGLDTLQAELAAEAGLPRSRPCIVCETPCRTEGQLCTACAAAGCRVTDDEVIVTIGIEVPEAFRR